MKKITLALLCICLPTLAFAADITVDCTPPAKNTDGSSITGAITYNLFGALQGQPKQLLTTTPLTTCHSVRQNVNPGTQCYEATAIVGGSESDHSSEACQVIAPSKPQPPTGVTLTVKASNPIAYKMRQSIGPDGVGIVEYVQIGTVAVGTSCTTSHNFDGFSLVPRTAVTMASRYDTLPLLVLAQCT